MTRSQLYATVARATGDSISVLKHLGFGILDPLPLDDQPQVAVRALDCPGCGNTIVLSWNVVDPLPASADCRCCSSVFDYRDDEVFSTDVNDLQRASLRSFVPAI